MTAKFAGAQFLFFQVRRFGYLGIHFHHSIFIFFIVVLINLKVKSRCLTTLAISELVKRGSERTLTLKDRFLSNFIWADLGILICHPYFYFITKMREWRNPVLTFELLKSCSFNIK